MIAHVLGAEALWLVEGKGPKRREDFEATYMMRWIERCQPTSFG